MKKILVLAIHPALDTSTVTRSIWEQLVALPGIECHDLYELYPDFYIDFQAEQEKLKNADLLVFLHPIYWYSAPSLLKEWQMRVLSSGFAYGKQETDLEGMDFWQIVSAGGSFSKYNTDGSLGCSMNEVLKPFEAMARKCKMQWHPPKVMYGAHSTSSDKIDEYARDVLHMLLNYQSQGGLALDDNIENIQNND